jgi:hypothetical protein
MGFMTTYDVAFSFLASECHRVDAQPVAVEYATDTKKGAHVAVPSRQDGDGLVRCEVIQGWPVVRMPIVATSPEIVMHKLFIIAFALSVALGFAPAHSNCGPAHPCQGALCQ